MPKQLCKYNAFLIFSFVRPFQKFNCERSTGRSTNSSMLLSPPSAHAHWSFQCSPSAHSRHQSLFSPSVMRKREELWGRDCQALSLKNPSYGCNLHHHQVVCCGKLLRFQQQSCFKFHSSSSSIKFEFLGGTSHQISCIWHSHMKNIPFLALPTKGLGYVDTPP